MSLVSSVDGESINGARTGGYAAWVGKVHLKTLLSLEISVKSALAYPLGLGE